MDKQKKIVDTIRRLFQTEEFIPLHIPKFVGNESKYVAQTIESTMVSSVGAFVDQFERDLAAYVKVPAATAIVNGTAGLQVALKMLGTDIGTEVITQALTFVATANAIHHNGAIPVFVDVDKDTMGLSPNALREFLEEFAEVREDGAFNKSSGRRIAACVPMHTFGFLCRIQEIVSICKEYRIPVVEDAAEALGSSYQGQPAGTFGDIGVFSFNGNKIITAGGGGALVSQHEELMKKAKYLTNTAKKPHSWEYFHDEFGYNFRMPNLNAALVCAQLEKIEQHRENKAQLFKQYDEFLSGSGLKLKPIPETTTEWNNWLISIELESKAERDQILEYTNKARVMTRPIWQLMFRLPMYKNCQRDKQENAHFLEERIVNIPSSSRL